MRRRALAAVATLAVLLGACTSEQAASTTTSPSSSSTLPTPTTTSTTTTTILPTTGDVVLRQNGPAFISSTDRGPYVAALQALLVCTGFDRPTPESPEMIVDGIYGPITARAVAFAQASMRRVPSGEVDEETFAELSRRCNTTKALEFEDEATTAALAGNVAPGDEEVYAVALLADQRITLDVREGDVDVVVESTGGAVLKSAEETTPWSGVAPADDAYRIRVSSEVEPISYLMEVEIPTVPAVTVEFGPMQLGPDGVDIARFGDPASDVLEVLTFVLGLPSDDTGWEVGREGGRVCEGTNRLVTWVVQPGPGQGAAVFFAAFSETGGARGFAQYGYRSDAPMDVDTGARGLTTAEGITIGSTLEQFTGAYGEPNPFNAELGLTSFADGMVAGITPEAVPGEGDGDPGRRYVWYVGAGEDGCLDFRE